MKSNEFIREHGLNRARSIVEGRKHTESPHAFRYYNVDTNDYYLVELPCTVCIASLQERIQDHELVDSYGGLYDALEVVRFLPPGIPDTNAIRDAIESVLECQ